MTFQTISINRPGIDDIPVNVQIDNSIPGEFSAASSGLVISDVEISDPETGHASFKTVLKKGEWIFLMDEEREQARSQASTEAFNALTDQQQRNLTYGDSE